MSIVYYSFADEEHASSLNKSRKWEIFPDTDDGHKQALAEGYTARSIYSFSIEPEKENNFISIRTGDLYLDIDGKVYLNSENKYRNAIDSALKSIRIIIETIKSKFDVDPNDLWYYASGGRGFHLVIPKEIIGSTHGDIFLPMIYKNLIKIISSYAEKLFNSEFNTDSKFIKNINTLSWLYIDTNLYKMGRGQLIRLPHIKRCNGKYKVPVTYDEIMNKDAEFFENIVLNDRNIDINYSRDNLKVSKKFETQFLYYKGFYSENEKEMNHLNTLRTIETNCDFIKYCIQNANDITELEWFCLARVLSTFKKDGLYLFHQISKLDYERYNKEEADKKFKHASNYPSVTCAELKDKNLCSKNCNVKCPIDLFNAKKYNKNNNYKYEIIDDWLVYMPDAEDPGSSIRVSSAIKVTAQARDEDSNSWSKIIELRDPDNKLHQILIENNKIACDKDNVIKTLTDNGLIISSDKKSKDRLMTYLNDEFPEKRAFITDKNGWIKNWLFCPHDLGLDISEQEYL